MCGFAGFLTATPGFAEDQMLAAAERMADTVAHRGPDDRGAWVDAAAGIALGHRRLSILDLSPEGHQPMRSSSGRFVVAFNGEIYNFAELRRGLEGAGHPFRGHSDTEVLLSAVSEWGVRGAVERFVGMFAFALWDRQERTLYLCRDRLGEKPLYYGMVGTELLFGSELKALRAHPRWNAGIDRGAVALFLRHGYVPEPYSIHEGIRKLTPGTLLTVRPGGGAALPEPESYWSLRSVAEAGAADPLQADEHEAREQLEGVLRDAVRGQMVADVPLGAFLSGGVDSSAVVAMMQTQSSRPIRTFTIGFDVPGFNEAGHARAVAAHLGTDHTEFFVSPEQALAVIPRLPDIYDEPFADSSQVPTSLVAQLARQSVTVSLSGDAGDELFGGYNRYFWGQSIWNKVGWIPPSLRRGVAGGMTAISPDTWDRWMARWGGSLPRRLRIPLLGDKLTKLSTIMSAPSREELYRRLVSQWLTPSELARGAVEPPTALTDRRQLAALDDFTRQMMYLDSVTYLPGDILTKVDRAAMAVSLETRVPFLDHRVVEFACRLPMSLKIRGREGKWLLRQVLYRHVPRELIDRPKMGFAIPIGAWLRGPLRDWAEALLSERSLTDAGLLDVGLVRQIWTEHVDGTRNHQYGLWNILMLQAWLERAGSGSGASEGRVREHVGVT